MAFYRILDERTVLVNSMVIAKKSLAIVKGWGNNQ